MASYKTPGVYVEEIPKLPQSVADVPTAIPGFVGYTEFASSKSDKEDKDGLKNKAVKINSLMEYERFFGKGPKLSVDKDGEIIHDFVTYDSIRLFYNNGGGVCYIVSIGDYDYETTTHKPEDFNNGLKQLEDIDEITLLVMPDATTCLKSDALASVQQQALLQCKTLKDRFAILDVKEEDDIDKSIENFRDNIGNAGLEYGAAYYPYVATTFSYELKFSDVVKYIVTSKYKDKEDEFIKIFNLQSFLTLLRSQESVENLKKYLEKRTPEELAKVYNPKYITYSMAVKENFSKLGLSEIGNKEIADKYTYLTTKLDDNSPEEQKQEEFKNYLIDKIKEELAPGEEYKDDLYVKLCGNEAEIKKKGDLFIRREIIIDKVNVEINKKNSNYLQQHLLDINPTDSDQEIKEQALKSFIPYYKELEEELVQKASVIPPSGAIAGIYAQNDNFVGVWKAPANMSIASVKEIY